MFRTVGDAVGPAAKDSERPVVELPKVRGREVVCRVSLGLVMGRWSPGGDERQDIVVEHECEGAG